MVNKDAALEFEKRTISRIKHLEDKRRVLKKLRSQKQSIEDDGQIEKEQLYIE